ncbi:Transcription factor SOX-11 [Camelus dromedarius]|uniref:Transcription factor SOX-11 n=1 Tax=Camelus dromedarius TaxID=9838 RepID=A0A5N4D704_CAMDR|nr:Transcription factor SOX-11 [Camelus dromedarius]
MVTPVSPTTVVFSAGIAGKSSLLTVVHVPPRSGAGDRDGGGDKEDERTGKEWGSWGEGTGREAGEERGQVTQGGGYAAALWSRTRLNARTLPQPSPMTFTPASARGGARGAPAPPTRTAARCCVKAPPSSAGAQRTLQAALGGARRGGAAEPLGARQGAAAPTRAGPGCTRHLSVGALPARAHAGSECAPRLLAPTRLRGTGTKGRRPLRDLVLPRSPGPAPRGPCAAPKASRGEAHLSPRAGGGGGAMSYKGSGRSRHQPLAGPASDGSGSRRDKSGRERGPGRLDRRCCRRRRAFPSRPQLPARGGRRRGAAAAAVCSLEGGAGGRGGAAARGAEDFATCPGRGSSDEDERPGLERPAPQADHAESNLPREALDRQEGEFMACSPVALDESATRTEPMNAFMVWSKIERRKIMEQFRTWITPRSPRGWASGGKCEGQREDPFIREASGCGKHMADYPTHTAPEKAQNGPLGQASRARARRRARGRRRRRGGAGGARAGAKTSKGLEQEMRQAQGPRGPRGRGAKAGRAKGPARGLRRRGGRLPARAAAAARGKTVKCDEQDETSCSGSSRRRTRRTRAAAPAAPAAAWAAAAAAAETLQRRQTARPSPPRRSLYDEVRAGASAGGAASRLLSFKNITSAPAAAGAAAPVARSRAPSPLLVLLVQQQQARQQQQWRGRRRLMFDLSLNFSQSAHSSSEQQLGAARRQGREPVPVWWIRIWIVARAGLGPIRVPHYCTPELSEMIAGTGEANFSDMVFTYERGARLLALSPAGCRAAVPWRKSWWSRDEVVVVVVVVVVGGSRLVCGREDPLRKALFEACRSLKSGRQNSTFRGLRLKVLHGQADFLLKTKEEDSFSLPSFSSPPPFPFLPPRLPSPLPTHPGWLRGGAERFREQARRGRLGEDRVTSARSVSWAWWEVGGGPRSLPGLRVAVTAAQGRPALRALRSLPGGCWWEARPQFSISSAAWGRGEVVVAGVFSSLAGRGGSQAAEGRRGELAQGRGGNIARPLGHRSRGPRGVRAGRAPEGYGGGLGRVRLGTPRPGAWARAGYPSRGREARRLGRGAAGLHPGRRRGPHPGTQRPCSAGARGPLRNLPPGRWFGFLIDSPSPAASLGARCGLCPASLPFPPPLVFPDPAVSPGPGGRARAPLAPAPLSRLPPPFPWGPRRGRQGGCGEAQSASHRVLPLRAEAPARARTLSSSPPTPLPLLPLCSQRQLSPASLPFGASLRPSPQSWDVKPASFC